MEVHESDRVRLLDDVPGVLPLAVQLGGNRHHLLAGELLREVDDLRRKQRICLEQKPQRIRPKLTSLSSLLSSKLRPVAVDAGRAILGPPRLDTAGQRRRNSVLDVEAIVRGVDFASFLPRQRRVYFTDTEIRSGQQHSPVDSTGRTAGSRQLPL